MAQLVWVGLASADRLPVVVRIPAGPLGSLKCDPPKGNGRRPQKRRCFQHSCSLFSRLLAGGSFGFRMVMCCFTHLAVWRCDVGSVALFGFRHTMLEMVQCYHLFYYLIDLHELECHHILFPCFACFVFVFVFLFCFGCFGFRFRGRMRNF